MSTDNITILGPGSERVTVEGEGNGPVTVLTNHRRGGKVYVLNTGDGPIKVTTDRGNVTVEQYDDHDDATSDNVDVSTCNGNVKVTTNGGGEVEVTNLDDDVSVTTYGGKITLKNYGGEVHVLNHDNNQTTITNYAEHPVTVVFPATDAAEISVQVGDALFKPPNEGDVTSIDILGGLLIVNGQHTYPVGGGSTRSRGGIVMQAATAGGKVYQSGGDMHIG